MLRDYCRRCIIALSIFFLFFGLSVALAENTSSYIPYVYLNGYGGDGAGNFLGRADFLMPMYTTNNKNLFVYGQGMYGDKFESDLNNVWSLSGGLGYRQIVGSRLYGAYVLTDYNSTSNDNQYWMISPGIETLGEIIDFRVNGYFPITDTKWTQDKSPTYIAHDTNHDVYQVDTYTESVGPGGDAEIGAKVFSISHMPVKLFLNGYYFSPRDQDNISGIGGRITLQPTRYLTLEVRDSYDNVNHNVVMAGMRLYLNGFAYGLNSTRVDDIGLQPRLYDQIERNLEAAGVGTPAMSRSVKESTKTTESDYYTVYVENGEGLVTETESGVTGSGTLEDPYVYTNEGDMQMILDNTKNQYGTDLVRIYFTSPNNTPFYMPDYVDDSSYVNVYSNQQIWGTTGDNWDIPTTADTYAVSFVGGFSLENESDVEFHYLKIDNYNNMEYPDTMPGSPFPTALEITNSQDTLLQSVQIGDESLLTGSGFATGIAMENYSSITLDDAKVYGSGSSGSINVIDGGNIISVNNTLVEGKKYAVDLLPDSDGNIIMGDFIGDTTSSFVGGNTGLYANNTLSGYLWIGDIIGSTFIGGSSNAVYARASNDDTTIGDIVNSKLQGASALVADGGNHKLTIGDIINSEITGYSSGGIYIFGSAEGIEVGNIINSALVGSSNGTSIITTGSITFGNIINSTFSGGSYAIYLSSNNNSIQIGDISGSYFIAGEKGIIATSYASLTVGGTSYSTNPSDLYTYLVDQDNKFNTPANKRVCLKEGQGGGCY